MTHPQFLPARHVGKNETKMKNEIKYFEKKKVSAMEFVFLGSRRVTVSGAVRTTAVEEALFEGDEEGRTLATLVLDCLKR